MDLTQSGNKQPCWGVDHEMRSGSPASQLFVAMNIRTRMRVQLVVAVCLVLTTHAVGRAQVGRVRADLTPIVGTDAAHAGTTVRAALQVRLPEGFHVNSNQPRDPALIPIRLSVEPPAGITVTEIVYPEPIDLRQQGVDEPLSVFEREFAIGVRLTLAGDLPAEEIAVPASLRYQACDETVCYFPVTAATGWTLRIVPAATPIVARHGDLMASIPFGRGAAPAAPVPVVEPGPDVPVSPSGEGDALAQLETFTMLGSTGGYLGSQDFLTFIQNAETGVQETGWFEGRGLLAILLISVLLGGLALNLTPCVLPMIPINLAIIGACVAPVVIQVVVFSSNLYATGTTAALALPFLLGLGMALPWPIAGGGIAALPKPGAWMVRVKQAFGVAILATATYFGYTAYGLFANRWVDPALVASSVEEKLKDGWHASLAEGLATAQRENRPVLIDLWATWCKNCLTMDKTTLTDPAVTAALTGYVKVKFQAEDPSESPVRDVMREFGAIGLPTYVILKPTS